MIALDTIHLVLPPEARVTVHADRFAWPTLRGVLKAKSPCMGVDLIECNTDTGEVSIKGSAKMLGALYFEGISTETLPLVAQIFSETGLITVTVDQLLQGIVRRADPVVQVAYETKADAEILLGLLFHVRALGYCRGERWPTSLRFYQRKKDLFRAYLKGPQMKLKKERQFVQTARLAPAEYDATVRFERSLTSYETMRKAFGLASDVIPTLGVLLAATISPVYETVSAACERLTTEEPDSLGLLAWLLNPEVKWARKMYRLAAMMLVEISAGDDAVIRSIVTADCADSTGTDRMRKLSSHLAACAPGDRARREHLIGTTLDGLRPSAL